MSNRKAELRFVDPVKQAEVEARRQRMRRLIGQPMTGTQVADRQFQNNIDDGMDAIGRREGHGSVLLCFGRNNAGAVLSSDLKGTWR